MSNEQVEWLLSLTEKEGGRAGRGERYFEEGRVKDIKEDGPYLRAVVEGTSDYDVRIAFTRVHDSRCSCPDPMFPCKHVYAVAHHVKSEPNLVERLKAKEIEKESCEYDERLKEAPEKIKLFLADLALKDEPGREAIFSPTPERYLRRIEKNSTYRETESYMGTTPHLELQEKELFLEEVALLNELEPEVVKVIAGWTFVAWAKGIEKDYYGRTVPEDWIWEFFPITTDLTDYYGLPPFVSGYHEPEIARERLEKARGSKDWYHLIEKREQKSSQKL
ncbi:MAG: SWIM zinc finger family protein [Candidatus Natronoplasma sp.]